MTVDLDAEVESHIAFAIDEYIRGGMTPEEARRQAMIRFGGREAAKELHRDAVPCPLLECLAQDLRYALRTMRREPGFTAFAILIVGLGHWRECHRFQRVEHGAGAAAALS